MEKYVQIILENILEYLDEGVHVIDDQGKTVIYNRSMMELEGMDKKDVMNKNILEVFPTLNEENSTLLQVLNSEKKLINHPQTYYNNHDKQITTINTTIPIILKNKKIGALEIAKNITKIKELAEQVMTLQIQLSQTDQHINLSNKFTFSSIIGHNKEFQRAIHYAKKASEFSSSVLIYGETGTGKELVAQSIHYASFRSTKPFLAQNCAAIPESLLESILFGTVRGSFTGAVNRPGLFEQANGGTLFLDEMNSMGMQLQSKLLRVLQEGVIRRVGGLENIPINVRIIASTNEDPYEAIQKGKIRKDLFYRLNVIPIHLPPLRKRKDDIKELVEYFIKKHNKKLSRNVKQVDENLIAAFKRYNWPGNVRELENVLEGAMNIIENECILKQEHFPPQVSAKIFAPNFSSTDGAIKSLPQTLQEIEKSMIHTSLKACHGNISKAALALGIKRQTLQHKLKKYFIDYE